MSHHSNLKVRFYPHHHEWQCVVLRLGADGMPVGEDLVSATGNSKEAALEAAFAAATDPEVRLALRPGHH